MFRHRITADESADVDAIIADTRSRLDYSNLSASARAFAVAEVSTIVRQFVDDGRKLGAHGSQYRANRDIKGEGYSIQVTYAPKAGKGWLARLLGR